MTFKTEEIFSTNKIRCNKNQTSMPPMTTRMCTKCNSHRKKNYSIVHTRMDIPCIDV